MYCIFIDVNIFISDFKMANMIQNYAMQERARKENMNRDIELYNQIVHNQVNKCHFYYFMFMLIIHGPKMGHTTLKIYICLIKYELNIFFSLIHQNSLVLSIAARAFQTRIKYHRTPSPPLPIVFWSDETSVEIL